MDKLTILDFCNHTNISKDTFLRIIVSYCEEMGKKPEEIQLLIQALTMVPMVIQEYLNYSLRYYKIKYGLTDLYRGDIFIKTF